MSFIRNKGCSCQLYEHPDHLYLGALETRHQLRNKGHASDLLLSIKKIAKRVNKPVILFVGAFGYGGPDNNQLISFYRKRGFYFSHEVRGTTYLKYNPKGNEDGSRMH